MHPIGVLLKQWKLEIIPKGELETPVKIGSMPTVTEECASLFFLHFLMLSVRVA